MAVSQNSYAGIPASFGKEEQATIVVMPVPFDLTSTWGKGADKGPEAMLWAAENMELYDIETDSEVFRRGIFLTQPPAGLHSVETMVAGVESAVASHLEQDKFVTVLGGEHSVSIGALRAFRQHFGSLSVLHLDAHADLRPEYEGSAYNHACALHESSQLDHLIQVGIRSMDISEKAFLNPSQTFFAHDIQARTDWITQASSLLRDPVYITIDLDVFDPSSMPSTGTPEPGGLDWYLVLELLKQVCLDHRVVGFDIVELSPTPTNRGPDFLAAKLHYKLLSYIFEKPYA